MGWAILRVTDGITSFNLLQYLSEWEPAIAEPKGGGVWRDSPLSDGRRMTFRRFGNVIESMKLNIPGIDQEAVIRETQDLRRQLEQAVAYWLDDKGEIDPVWVEARANCETNSRFALIYDYRTPKDDQPYGAQFNGVPLVSFAEWEFSFERGHWLGDAPGAYTCLPVTNQTSGYTYGANLVLNNSFETAGGGGADVFLNWTESAGDGAIASEAGTIYHLTRSAKLTSGAASTTYVEQSFAVAALSTYLVSFWSYSADVAAPARYQVRDNTAGVDIVATTSILQGAAPAWAKTSIYVTAPAGCISMLVRLHCPDTDTKIAYFDYVVARLRTAHTFGHAASCVDDAVYMANGSRRAQLTDAYWYDDSIATFSANRIGAALPYAVFPAVPAAADILYVGIDDAAVDSGPFSNIIGDFTAGSSLAGVWEYWTGAAWAAIAAVYGYGFMSLSSAWLAGINRVYWQPPAGWLKGTVNGVYGWWVRYRATAGAAAPPTQQNRQLYTANRPNLSASGALLLGDIPDLARHAIGGPGRTTTPFIERSFLLWTRSNARGASFDPFFNLTDNQLVTYTEVLLSSATITFANETAAPTGRCLFYNPAAVDSSQVDFQVLSPLNAEYRGSFRAFLRVRQNGGGGGDMSVTMTVRTMTDFVCPRAYTVSTNMELLDLGPIAIPSQAIARAGAAMPPIRFIFTVQNTRAAGAGDLYIYDLILIPTDETCVEVRGVSSSSIVATTAIFSEVDSLSARRMLAVDRIERAGTVYTVQQNGYTHVASRASTLPPGESALMGVLWLADVYPHLISLDQVDFVPRYLSMRGDR